MGGGGDIAKGFIVEVIDCLMILFDDSNDFLFFVHEKTPPIYVYS